jgi:ACS family hexuronate transporter-like MFS transporter
MKRGGNYRWVICGLLFFSVAINYIDRLVIGILKAPLSAKLGWSEIDYGNIAAAFSFAYAFGYLIGGRAMDRFGVKRGLPLFVLAWSLAAAAHGLCGLIGLEATFRMNFPWFSWAENGFVWMTLAMPMTAAGFMLARIALGLTEGANFPGAIKATAEWFPVKERALATGWFNAGSNVGAILCPVGVPWLFEHLGWEATFYITGATGFLWVAAWWRVYEAPEKHKRLSQPELNYIREGQPVTEERPPAVPWRILLRYRAVWAYVLASIFAGPAWGFYQFFLPDFLKKSFQLGLQEMGWWTRRERFPC